MVLQEVKTQCLRSRDSGRHHGASGGEVVEDTTVPREVRYWKTPRCLGEVVEDMASGDEIEETVPQEVKYECNTVMKGDMD